MFKAALLGIRHCLAAACLASCSAATPVTADVESWTNGSDIADYLLTVAKANNGVVTLSSFGTKICVEPPGGFGKPAAEGLHGKPVAYEESIASEGVWFISVEKSKYVYVYAIPLAKLNWQMKKNVPVRDLTRCPDAIRINFQETIPVASFE